MIRALVLNILFVAVFFGDPVVYSISLIGWFIAVPIGVIFYLSKYFDIAYTKRVV